MPRVILVKKQSAWEQHHASGGDFGNLSLATRVRMEGSHRRHTSTLAFVMEALADLRIKPWFVDGAGSNFKAGHGDLVITVGGDGTVLSSSHNVGPKARILAINSDPVFSTGRFCQVFKKKSRLVKVIQQAISGEPPFTLVQRMTVTLDKQVISRRVLNEVLFSHTCPAAMTRFAPPGGKLRYACSGLWVGTGAGSTGAIRSAGGEVRPLRSKQLQTVVREVCDAQSTGPIVWHAEKFFFTSLTPDATLFLDGAFLRVPVGFEQVMKFEISDEPLFMVGKLR